MAQNLTSCSASAFVLRADSTNVVAAGERGRKSVRLVSAETFKHHVAMYVASNPCPHRSIADPPSHDPQLRRQTHAARLQHMAGNLGGGPGHLARGWGNRHPRGCKRRGPERRVGPHHFRMHDARLSRPNGIGSGDGLLDPRGGQRRVRGRGFPHRVVRSFVQQEWRGVVRDGAYGFVHQGVVLAQERQTSQRRRERQRPGQHRRLGKSVVRRPRCLEPDSDTFTFLDRARRLRSSPTRSATSIRSSGGTTSSST